MPVLLWILLAVSVVSLVSLLGALTLYLRRDLLERTLFFLISFAAGTLLGAAFLDLIPEALETGSHRGVFYPVITGIVTFFLLEKLLHWFHHHDSGVHPFTYLNLVGDGVHNFIDGAIIATSFLVSVPLGLVTSLAVIAHEIPQEIGDFGILIYGGFSRKKALFYNFLSALSAFLGALLAYFFASAVEGFANFLAAFAAGGFIYIASADLIPELQKELGVRRSLYQLLAFLGGIGLIHFITRALG